jgi:hypothetical protein
MGWIESRLGALEGRFENLLRRVEDLYQKVIAAQQLARNAFQAQSPGGSGGTGSYVAYPAVTIGPYTSVSLTVYQTQGGVQTSIGAQTVWNYGNSATIAGDGSTTFTLYLIPDGAGNYTIYTQTCS